MDRCPKCGSTNTVRHSQTATLKPNWLHCRDCALCAPAEQPEVVPAEPDVRTSQEEETEKTAAGAGPATEGAGDERPQPRPPARRSGR